MAPDVEEGRSNFILQLLFLFLVFFSEGSVTSGLLLQVAQFLVGLAERPAPNTYPRR